MTRVGVLSDGSLPNIVWKEDGRLILVLLLFELIAYLARFSIPPFMPGTPSSDDFWTVLTAEIQLVVALLGMILIFQVLRRFREGFSGARAAFQMVRINYLNRESLAGLGLIMLGTPLFLDAYHKFKSGLTHWIPFYLDRPLMKLDFLLHGGNHPWVLLQPILGTPWITRILDFWYWEGWIRVLVLVLLGMAWTPDRRLRKQFFYSFFAIWIIQGTVLALALSSAGPCYYERLVPGANPFAELMAYLGSVDAQQPLSVLRGQEGLWMAYRQNLAGLGIGISAMPSIHIAGVVLCALAGRRVHPLLGWLLGVHALMILVGSVHLGWHYAVDGYVGIVLTCLTWAGVGRMVNRETRGLQFLFHRNGD